MKSPLIKEYLENYFPKGYVVLLESDKIKEGDLFLYKHSIGKASNINIWSKISKNSFVIGQLIKNYNNNHFIRKIK